MTDVFNRDGLDRVADDEMGEFGLGLQVPAARPLSFDTLAESRPLLSTDEIRRIVESQDFRFGRHYFDASWTTNQNGYGSCAGYGGMSGVEKMRVMAGQDVVRLSGDYLYSLVNGGRDRGSMLDANMKAIMSRGVATKETVPLGGIYPRKYDTARANAEAQRFRGHELYAVPDEQSMATALALADAGGDRDPRHAIVAFVPRRQRVGRVQRTGEPLRTPGRHQVGRSPRLLPVPQGHLARRRIQPGSRRLLLDPLGRPLPGHAPVPHVLRRRRGDPGSRGDQPAGARRERLPSGAPSDGDAEGDEPVRMRSLRPVGRGRVAEGRAGGMARGKDGSAGGAVPRFRIEKGGRTKDLVGYRAFEELSREAEGL